MRPLLSSTYWMKEAGREVRFERLSLVVVGVFRVSIVLGGPSVRTGPKVHSSALK